MVDFKLPATTWDFLYSFRSRRTDGRIYRIRVTGEFVKSHSLKEGDTFIIYQSQESGKFFISLSVGRSPLSSVLPCPVWNARSKPPAAENASLPREPDRPSTRPCWRMLFKHSLPCSHKTPAFLVQNLVSFPC